MPLVSMFKGDPNLGSVNQFVMLLQRFLVMNGKLERDATGVDPVDGTFGPVTDAAVGRFQATYNGVVDGATWAAIAGVTSPLAVVNPSVASSNLPQLFPGDTDSVVIVLQRLLFEYSGNQPGQVFIASGLMKRADVGASGGVFDSVTKAAVANFQENRQLPPPFDGKIGPLTWEKLLFPKG